MTDRERAMAEMYLSGRPLREVGEAFGLTRQRVQQILSKVGVERRSTGCHGYRIAIPMEKVRELRAAGKTWAEIGEKLGCLPDTVMKRAIKHGVPQQAYRYRAKERKIGDKSDPLNVRIAELAGAGKSVVQIAAAVGVSKYAVSYRMVACGIQPAHEAKCQRRRRNDKDDPWNKEIARLLSAGRRPEEIASAMGLSRATVQQRIMICDMRPGEEAA